MGENNNQCSFYFEVFEGVASIDVFGAAREILEREREQDPDFYADLKISDEVVQSFAIHILDIMEGKLDDDSTFGEWYWQDYQDMLKKQKDKD